ncbi:MAG: polyprenyl synthetase family protein [Clostridia bacterium]|nr:polyprenyl synthetase family protein [Clostridia bacterium]
MDFKEKYQNLVEAVNLELDKLTAEVDCPQRAIYQAMRYSLMAGGKRLRPVLAMAVSEMLGGNYEEVLPFGCAIEMIHTYSLIHDDLPSMDNDDYRRGRLTCHKVFGEAKAILAGDALLNLAFEVMSDEMLKSQGNIASKAKAMSIIAKASGVSGMIGGQVIDLESEGRIIPAALLGKMHACKTGALIKAPVLASAVLNNASCSELEALESYAENIGLAFQVKDDILDVEGDSSLMGKPAGSDEANQKSTYVSIYGLDESKRMLAELIDKAVKSLCIFGQNAQFLKALAEYIMIREN